MKYFKLLLSLLLIISIDTYGSDTLIRNGTIHTGD